MSDHISDHNADHPYEFHVLRLVDECLSACKFPSDRIKVRIEFTPTLTTWSKSKLDLELLGSTPSGEATILYNSLFLTQDPMAFFEQVVAHEVAHVLNAVSAYKQGLEVSEHGVEWMEWLEKISETAAPQASISDANFDARAVLLKKGGILAICSCESTDSFQAHRNSGEKIAQIRKGELTCQQCGDAFRIAGSDEIPDSINADLRYISEDIKERNT